MRLEFTIPIRTVPGLNAREHWAKRAKRVKQERAAAHLMAKLPAANLKRVEEKAQDWARFYPLEITLVRVKPRGPKTDSDNLQGAMKAIRDGIADAFGIDDGDETVAAWRYGQGKGPWGVRVIIRDAMTVEIETKLGFAEEAMLKSLEKALFRP